MMIEETGLVTQVTDHYIWVTPVSSSGGCGGCKSSGNCSTSLFATLLQREANKSVRIANTINAKVNDTVVLGIPSQSLLLGSALIYLLPLLSLFLFAGFGQQLFGEMMGIIAGLIGFVFGLLSSKKIAHSALIRPQLALVGLRIQ
jgi:sigma-E factor negative regulatory protein RseC